MSRNSEQKDTPVTEASYDNFATYLLSIFLTHDTYVWEIRGGCKAQFGDPERFTVQGSDNNFEPFSVQLLQDADQRSFGRVMQRFLPNLAKPDSGFTVYPADIKDTRYVGERKIIVVGRPMRYREENGDRWKMLEANRALQITIISDGTTAKVPSFTMIPQHF